MAVSVACQVCSLCGVEQPRVSCSDVREWRDAGVESMQGANQPVIATEDSLRAFTSTPYQVHSVDEFNDLYDGNSMIASVRMESYA